jgi:signal peptidase II
VRDLQAAAGAALSAIGMFRRRHSDPSPQVEVPDRDNRPVPDSSTEPAQNPTPPAASAPDAPDEVTQTPTPEPVEPVADAESDQPAQTETEPEPAATEPTPNAGETVPRAHRRTLVVLLLALFVVAVDQISKALVVAKLTGHDPVKVAAGAVYLLEERNKGAAFSLGEGYTILFTLVAATVVVIVVRVSSRLQSLAWAAALGLILGGAAGNLSDRLFRAPGPLRGAVVDWISLFDPEGRVWPVFNLADASIVCGGVIAVILMLMGRDLTVSPRR